MIRPARLSLHRGRRGGFSTISLLMFSGVAIGMCAMAVDMAMITLSAQQIQGGVNAASLAAGAELFDRSLLPPCYSTVDIPPADMPGTYPSLEEYQAARSRLRALQFAAVNEAQGQPITLVDNPLNATNGDIVLGVVEDATAPAPLLVQWPVGPSHFNAVLIKNPRTAERGNPLTLWLAKYFGHGYIDVTVSSQAAFDQHVYGFQPGGQVPIPMVPILVRGDVWPSAAAMNCGSFTSDRFTVDPITDQVTGSLAPGAPAPDGFAEVTLRVQRDNTTGQAFLLPVSGTPSPPYTIFQSQLQVQIQTGMLLADLDPSLGGEISLPQGPGNTNGNLDLPLAPSPGTTNATFLGNLVASFNAIKGKKRIFPLGQIVTNGMGAPVSSRISGFVAGRIVHCSIDDNGTANQDDDSLRLVVQPCLLQTSTALLRPSSPANAWLGKLLLVR